ncbi:type 2 lantipeptide synthetase LanM [Nocardioides sp. ChNu-153]|uniref:type 2 lanthipeptide synthetase LanM n=1 Tax=Nocardioides sp. ChNu-153 TaxID=2779364 RepID=UPI0026506D28|nr:type 2 lanthipeptide synthetase LanM [Nocardioides sp. ChNu-153]MDN7122117.1 type 2 lantipeptide synthetase LanM [Nocardioides sp. ChNu-153]
MSATFYPELTSSEVDEIIEPLADLRLDLRDEHVLDALPPRRLPLDSFGEGAETYTFARISEAVSAHVYAALWDPDLDLHLADPAAFRAQVELVLVRDFFDLAVRPLADLLVPREGVDSAEAYRRFCAEQLAYRLRPLALAHPVTWSRVGTRLERRMAAVAETVRRVVADADDVHRHLGVAPARIAGLSLAGDTHAGGRSVSVVTLEGGVRVVYKPRPVDAEAAYADLARRWNALVGTDLQAASVLARDGYGYVEFVEATPGAEPDLDAIGELAAVLYALNARDMHFENILATARGPVPVDLETLLHPQRHKARGLVETDLSAYRKMDTSVFAMGVLPMVMARADRDGYVDVGFLGGGEARGSGPFRRFAVEHPFRAEVRVHWDGRRAPEPQRREELPRDAQRRTIDAITAMTDGFARAYEQVLAHREEFRALVVELFGTARLRYVHNATVQYEQCLRTLTGAATGADPRLAASLLKRIAIASRGADHRLVASECTQMWDTDVPYLLVRADQSHLTAAHDPTPVADLVASPLAQQQRKLDRLGERDLAEQLQLIRIALSAKLPDPHGMYDAAAVFASAAPAARRTTDRGALRDLAARLAHEIADEQVEDRYPHLPHTWVGPVASSDSERPWPPGVLGYDLYTGRTGPATTLAAAGVVLGEERFVAAARHVFDPVARILAANSYESRSLAAAGQGAYNGFAGATWGIWQAGRLLDDPALLDAARTAHALVPTGDVHDGWFDVVAGGVGRWLVLGDDAVTGPEGPGGRAPDQVAEAVLHALGTDLPGRLAASGLAHGVSGLLLLAARALAATGHEPARDLAVRCHDELLSGFRTAGQDAAYPLRTNRAGVENHTDSWCNGSAGTLVALGEAVRVGALPAGVLEAPLAGIRASRVATSLTLCHGALGLRDALGLVGAAAPGTPAAAEADRLRADLDTCLGADLVERRLADPLIRYNQSPGLMTGRAGVLWHLLDRVEPGVLASPLAFARGITGATA